ncbi:MAG: PD-(D/E)XK nuclease family protein, partial [Myxococcota bacterium]
AHGTLLGRLAAPVLDAEGRTPVSGLGLEALVTRVVYREREAGRLGPLAPLGAMPGFPRALARTLKDLRRSGRGPDDLAGAPGAGGIASLFAAYVRELEAAQLVDRAGVVAAATRALSAPQEALGRTLVVLLDPAGIEGPEAALVAALGARAEHVLLTLPAGDARGRDALQAALAAPRVQAHESVGPGALGRVQTGLFEAGVDGGAADGTLVVLAAGGEAREAVEVVRRLLAAADEGVVFDRMAIALRDPPRQRAAFAEALGRAGVPARFEAGTRRPDPGGRALLALLRCRSEDYSARAFAAYLSLGVLPSLDAGAPPPALPDAALWVPPAREDEDAPRLPMPEDVAAATPGAATPGAADVAHAGLEGPALHGTLRTPRRWERLLEDAAVIGGRARWTRRLAALRAATERALAALDAEAPERARYDARLDALDALEGFALPTLAALEELPAEGASWGDWLAALRALTSRAIRSPERVLQVLAELQPLAPVTPVSRVEVENVLRPRLADLVEGPEAADRGVLVASVSALRGRDFDVVAIPGLAEGVFPPKLRADPLLGEEAREALGLPTRRVLAEEERGRLRLAVGAAERRVIASWSTLEAAEGRSRVPSFYALELVRAAEGRLPRYAELAAQATAATTARVGWPAPADPDAAIDVAEHDLSMLRRALEGGAKGALAHLHDAPFLKRALGQRARRWRTKKWTAADGLIATEGGELAELLAPHRTAARSYSATGLQRFASCPYQFALYHLLKLQPRETPEAIETLDALQRGSLVHDVQFETLRDLRDAGLRPLAHPQVHAAAGAVLDAAFDRVAAEYEELLAPAIPRVWEDALETLRGDLHRWLGALHRTALDEGWEPEAFELAFGLRTAPGETPRRDAASQDAPVPLDLGEGVSMRLRGAIDLVEASEESLRATDHKTGRVPPYLGARNEPRIAGGRALQPLLYARALEELRPEARVLGGRLHYCTARGGFEERHVVLDDAGREELRVVVRAVDEAVERGFLPAAPLEGACRWCDYAEVCGPHEERRTKNKRGGPLASLVALRGRQ